RRRRRPDLAVSPLDHGITADPATEQSADGHRMGVGLSLPTEGQRGPLRDAEPHDGWRRREGTGRTAVRISGGLRAARRARLARAVGTRARCMAASTLRRRADPLVVVLLLRD